MKSRIGPPLIWPPNRNETSNGELGLLERRAFVGRGRADRAADAAARPGTWSAPCRSVSSSPVSGFSRPSISRLTTDCETDRLPAVASAITRSPGTREDVQLAEGRDVVEARIGARVRDHHEALLDQDAGAIGHRTLSAASPIARSGDQRNRPWRQGCRPLTWTALPGRLSSTAQLDVEASREPPPWRAAADRRGAEIVEADGDPHMRLGRRRCRWSDRTRPSRGPAPWLRPRHGRHPAR